MEDPPADIADSIILGLETAPELFVEGYRGALYRAGVVKLNFFATRTQGPDLGIAKQAVSTLSIPLIDLKEVVPALSRLIEHIEAQEVAALGSGVP